MNKPSKTIRIWLLVVSIALAYDFAILFGLANPLGLNRYKLFFPSIFLFALFFSDRILIYYFNNIKENTHKRIFVSLIFVMSIVLALFLASLVNKVNF